MPARALVAALCLAMLHSNPADAVTQVLKASDLVAASRGAKDVLMFRPQCVRNSCAFTDGSETPALTFDLADIRRVFRRTWAREPVPPCLIREEPSAITSEKTFKVFD